MGASDPLFSRCWWLPPSHGLWPHQSYLQGQHLLSQPAVFLAILNLITSTESFSFFFLPRSIPALGVGPGHIFGGQFLADHTQWASKYPLCCCSHQPRAMGLATSLNVMELPVPLLPTPHFHNLCLPFCLARCPLHSLHCGWAFVEGSCYSNSLCVAHSG